MTEIQPHYEAFYIEALASHTTTALMLGRRVNRNLERMDEIPAKHRIFFNQQILDDLQIIIASAAALSKYFWPASKDPIHQSRGVQLRAVFEVNDESPIKSRELRNSLEHFDERLDELCQTLVAGNVMPAYVGLKGKDSGVPDYFFRAFFIDTAEFRLFKQEYPINPILGEIGRIHDILEPRRNCGRFYL